MKIEFDAKELGQLIANHINGCLHGKSSEWTVNFKIKDNEIYGAEFYDFKNPAPAAQPAQKQGENNGL